jgi:hypothetical protein
MIAGMLLVISFAGCKSTTKPEPPGILAGKVICENVTKNPEQGILENSGVTVSLYNLTVLDTTLVRINTIHPGIGVKIDQETEFDHRKQAPLFTTTTNSSGEFSISSIPAGTYNVSILKNEWSVKYLYNVSITSGNTNNVGEISIWPSISLSGYIADAFTFQADRTYMINTTASFASPVIFETGARIYVEANESIKFYNTLTSVSSISLEKYWKLDTAKDLYTTIGTIIDSTSYFYDVSIFQGCQLNSGLLRNLRNGVNVFAGNINISNSELRNYSSGFYFDQGVGTQISNVNMRNGSSRGIHAMGYADTLRVEKCIFSKNYEGILIYGRGVSVQDTYFIDNGSAIRPQVCTGVFRYCNFYGNEYDIRLYNAVCNINSNNFYYSKELTIYPRRTVQLRNNNFYKTDYRFITVRGYDANNSIVSSNVDAIQNYWAVSNIDDYIIDAVDNPSYPGLENPFYVVYLPKKNSRVITAGIRE